MKTVRNVLLAALVFTILTSAVIVWGGPSCTCSAPADDCSSGECDSGSTDCCGCGTVSSECTCCDEPCNTCSSTSGGKHGNADCVDFPV